MIRLWALLLMAFISVSGVSAQEVRPRLVSLDYCADQFVLALADSEQILALSKDADKAFSHLRERAEGHRQVRAAAEDVIALQPDLVIRSWGGDARALSLYERVGIETFQLGYASDIEGAGRLTLEVAKAIGQGERGVSLVADMPLNGDSVGARALYVTPGGVTAGTGTMVESLMNHAGLTNAVSAAGWQGLPMEQLVLDPPKLVLTAFFGFDADRSDHWSVSRHPVMQRVLANAEVYALDESRLTCPAWFVADEARDLRLALEGAR